MTGHREVHRMSSMNAHTSIGCDVDNVPLADHLMGEWEQALAGDQYSQAQWQIDEGDDWV
jgi:hypothetical protein